MKHTIFSCVAALLALNVHGAEPLSEGDFDRLHALAQPQPGEAKWATIPWFTNLEDARSRAVREDKPLFVWRAGGGEVLGRA